MTEYSDNSMIAQVQSLPEMIRTEFDALDERVRTLMNHEEWLSVKRVIITGCGDSHMAGIAAELAFEQLAGIPAEPMRAMKGRYAAPYKQSHYPRNPLVFGISASGSVSRTREAVGLFKKHGMPTVAITGNPQSPLAELADKVLDCSIPDFPFAPGVRSYRMSLLALYLLAIRLGEVQDRYSQQEANALRQELRDTAEAVEATVQAVNENTRALAEAVAGEKSYVFVGDGPNFATALFGAAKVIEATGCHAMGQETEEWAHLQYFTHVETTTPTFLISPGYRGHHRVGELLEPLQRIGRTIVAVTPDDDKTVAPGADWHLPLLGTVREAFTPMVTPLATELFAAHLSEVQGRAFFREDSPLYTPRTDIRDTLIVESVED